MTPNEEMENVFEKALDELCRSLNLFGSEEVLKLLVCFSDKDSIVNQLLIRVASICSVGDFLYRLPSYEVDEETFKNLVKTHGSIWLKKAEKREREDNLETHSKIPKKRKIAKNKKRRVSPAVIDGQSQGVESLGYEKAD